MADIGRDFFLEHSAGAGGWEGVNAIHLPNHPHLLARRCFVRHQGAAFREFLLSPIGSGERKPRTLPRTVYDTVERFVSAYRRSRPGHDTAYLVEVVGTGARVLRWTLENKVSLREVRWGASNDQLRIERFSRRIHYRVAVTAFDDEAAMNRWRRLYQLLPLPEQRDFKRALEGQVDEEAPWFELLGWQRLPDEFVARLTDEAKGLVFPSGWRQLGEAIYRERFTWNPLLFVPQVAYHFLWAKIDHPVGPPNCVETIFRGFCKVNLYEGVLPVRQGAAIAV